MLYTWLVVSDSCFDPRAIQQQLHTRDDDGRAVTSADDDDDDDDRTDFAADAVVL